MIIWNLKSNQDLRLSRYQIAGNHFPTELNQPVTVAHRRATAVRERIRLFNVAPVSSVTEVSASKIPWKVAGQSGKE